MRRLALTILACTITYISQAQQDRHYSMFYASPMAINPGATGFFPGDLQLFTGFKNQWKSISSNPYNTVSASVDSKLLKDKLNGGFLGLGANFYNDKSGDGNLTTNVANISLSYALQIADGHQIALGVQPSFFQRFIGSDAMTWDTQWTGSTFDSNIESGEIIITDKSYRFDVNSGVYYYGELNDQNSVNIGFSVAHLIQPENSIISGTDNLYRKYTVHAGGEFGKRGSKIAFAPNVIFFKQGPNKEFSLGTDFKYFLKESSKYTGYYDQTSVSLGTYLRLGDAFYSTLFFNMSGFSLGLSYDLNLSNLSVATNGRGGMEFLLRYRISLSKVGASSFN